MATADHLTTLDALGSRSDRPLALIALAACTPDAVIPVLPPCPVIGIGDPAHPLAVRLDAVVEPPIGLNALVRSIGTWPDAAASLIDLLRSSDDLAPPVALTLESMCMAMLQGSADHARWRGSRGKSAPMPPGSVSIARDGTHLKITTARPDARNAIDRAMRDGLHDAFTVAASDPEVTRITWRAEGRAFSVGADLAEFGTTRDPATAHRIRMRTLPAWPLLACADRTTVVVQGACIGAGLEMAAFAQRIVARPDAWFQLPELAMGIIPGAGGCVSIPRRIGRQRAALLMLSGRRIDARTALRWGLVDAIEDAPPGDDGGAHPD